ncbi:hypothetical protein SD80_012295 [Scytonema tolypothrichoides VB-61278]|nr:hypothetical protein SD80_012295 [Scytonema tolypothrichoides VB-61278]
MLFLPSILVLVFVVALTIALFCFLSLKNDVLSGRSGCVFLGWLSLCALLLGGKSMFIVSYYDYFALEAVLVPLVFVWGTSVLAVISISAVLPNDESKSEMARDNSLANLKHFSFIAVILLFGLIFFWSAYSPSLTTSIRGLTQGPMIIQGRLEAVNEEGFRRTGSALIDGKSYILTESGWLGQPLLSTVVFVTDPSNSVAFSPTEIGSGRRPNDLVG